MVLAQLPQKAEPIGQLPTAADQPQRPQGTSLPHSVSRTRAPGSHPTAVKVPCGLLSAQAPREPLHLGLLVGLAGSLPVGAAVRPCSQWPPMSSGQALPEQVDNKTSLR